MAMQRAALPAPVVLRLFVLCLSLCGAAAISDPPAGATFAFGNYIVTQKALDDAPQRYTKFLKEALQKAENTQLPDKSGGGGCGLSYSIIASQAKIDIEPDWDSLVVKIAADGFVANVTASITISNVRTTVKDCHKVLYVMKKKQRRRGKGGDGRRK